MTKYFKFYFQKKCVFLFARYKMQTKYNKYAIK